nr:NADH-quinone oxidoreductase subunit H [Candidatus Hydrogenedentota bacterium]
MNVLSLTTLLLPFVCAPALLGIINKTKAFFAGRKGVPVLQAYFELWKLLHKGAVYSRTTTWVFRAGPMIGLACVMLAAALAPFGGVRSAIAFPCDLILFAYLFGVMRFVTVLAALDTGSSFEGMGASREVAFSALAEPALLVGLAAVARLTGSCSLSDMFQGLSLGTYLHAGPVLVLVGGALLIVFLTENARIPVDDPNTHLE